jgi:hypothetical protein
MAKKSVMSQLASVGEEALGKLAQNPAAHKAIQGALQMKERVDDLSKRVRGLEALEKRLDKLEKRLDKLDKPARKPPSKTGGASKASGAAKKGGSASGS